MAPEHEAGYATGGLFSVCGRTALVTGGSSGIGRMIARGYVEAGARVYIVSRKTDVCNMVAAELSEIGDCTALSADLSRESECERVAADLAHHEGRMDILVNNAGATWAAPLSEHNEDSWERVLAVNVKGMFHLTKFCLPLLRAAGTTDDPACVINIGSVDGLSVPPHAAYSYAASKAAVHHLTRHLAATLAPEVTVNAIAPGAFESRMMASTLISLSDVIIGRTPMNRIGRPSDMAGIAIYLASRAGSFVTGAVIPVDGGIGSCR